MAYEGPSSGVINIISRTSSGSGVYVPVTPSADVGGDGDFAFDQNTNTLYGPKDSTQTNPWPVSGLSIGNGRYTWRAAWSSSNSYNAGDIVHYNAQQFVCIKTLDYGSPVAWTAQEYTAGSYVTYSSVLYVCVVDALSGDVPGTATTVWKQATPNVDAANYAFAAQGNFLRLSSSIQAETSLASSSGTMRLAIAQNALLYGAYPIAPQGIETGATFPNYLVDSQAVDSSSSLELSTTTFTTPAWNSGGGSATVEVKASGVTTAKIADAAVTNAKLLKTSGSEAVSTGAIRDSAVTTAKLADSSVTSAKIVNGTIATADIASGAITQPLLGSEAVGDGNISPYVTTATNSPSAYLPATKIVSASTTASGTSISTTNTVVDKAALSPAYIAPSNVGEWKALRRVVQSPLESGAANAGVALLPVQLAQSSIGTLIAANTSTPTGTVLASWGYVPATVSVQHVRFAYSTALPADIMDVRVGIWNGSSQANIATSSNLVNSSTGLGTGNSLNSDNTRFQTMSGVTVLTTQSGTSSTLDIAATSGRPAINMTAAAGITGLTANTLITSVSVISGGYRLGLSAATTVALASGTALTFLPNKIIDTRKQVISFNIQQQANVATASAAFASAVSLSPGWYLMGIWSGGAATATTPTVVSSASPPTFIGSPMVDANGPGSGTLGFANFKIGSFSWNNTSLSSGVLPTLPSSPSSLSGSTTYLDLTA